MYRAFREKRRENQWIQCDLLLWSEVYSFPVETD
jgi:hypothetical protein